MFFNKGLNKLQILTALISWITVNRYKNEFRGGKVLPLPTSLSQKQLENHDEHNILLATVKYTKETSTLKEMNKMLLPTHLGYHPEVGPEPTHVAILRSRPTCHTA